MQNTLTHDLIFSRNSSTSVYEFQNIAELDASLKVMASPQKMQQYMDRHRIGPLFEVLLVLFFTCFILFFETLNISDLYERVLLGMARISSKN